MATILVIDDDAGYRAILRSFIEEKGHSVIEAEGADQGLRAFSGGKIDLVISDLMMPNKSGLELLQELKRLQSKVLFIMVTGFPTADMANAALKAGAYDFLAKPVEMTQLAAVMTRALATIEMKARLSTLRGVNVALLVSIPFWILIGIAVRIFLLR